MRRAKRALTLAVLATALTACTTTAAGTPTPQPGSSTSLSTSPTGPDGDVAPPVDDPKQLRGVDACALLKPQQLAQLTLTAAGAKDTTPWKEDQCVWQNSALIIAAAPDTRRAGLTEVYKRRDNFDSWEKSEVDGYPAVRVDFATNFCTVFVGVADDQILFVDFSRVTGKDPAYDDPCRFVESIASMVLANLKAA